MSYLALKHVHMTAVVLSLALFVLRGLWMASDSPRLAARWVKVVPHVIEPAVGVDRILLAVLCAAYAATIGGLGTDVVILGMVVIGILAAIAIPNYSEYVMRGHRSAAQAYISDLASRQSQFFLDRRRYDCRLVLADRLLLRFRQIPAR